MNQLFAGLFEHSTSNACIADLTPPTFGGITGLSLQPTGALLSSWPAASDATTPIRYEVYIQQNTATGLFSTANITLITNNLSAQIFTLADNTQLLNGTTYYVGVRAVDSVGNRDSNLVSMSAISTGVVSGTIQYTAHAGFSITASNMLQIEFWVKANGVTFNNLALLGAANFTIRDATDATVGITQSGITANSNGKYIATPVSAPALIDLTHYVIDFGIIVDGTERKNSVALTLGE